MTTMDIDRLLEETAEFADEKWNINIDYFDIDKLLEGIEKTKDN
ncbi:hypothetical protein [Bacillus spongiae]